MDLDYEILKKEIVEIIERNKIMVLATSDNNRVTARSMSIINEGLKIYFQTDKKFLKYIQMENNSKVALCIDNIQIEGTVRINGHPSDNNNTRYRELYKMKHEGSYVKYSMIETEVVIEVIPLLITIWKYINNQPCRDFLFVNEKAIREYYYTN